MAPLQKAGRGTSKCTPIASLAFKNHMMKSVPRTTLAGMSPKLKPKPGPGPNSNATASLFIPSVYHHPSSYPSHPCSPWYSLPPHHLYANYHPLTAWHGYPQLVYPNYLLPNYLPPPLVMNPYSHPLMGPTPQFIKPGQNSIAISDFCTEHRLNRAARDTLAKLMSGVWL